MLSTRSKRNLLPLKFERLPGSFSISAHRALNPTSSFPSTMDQPAPRPLDRTASLQRAREAKRLKREQKKEKAARLHQYRWKNREGLKDRLENRLAKVPGEEGSLDVSETVEIQKEEITLETGANQPLVAAGQHPDQADTEKQD